MAFTRIYSKVLWLFDIRQTLAIPLELDSLNLETQMISLVLNPEFLRPIG